MGTPNLRRAVYARSAVSIVAGLAGGVATLAPLGAAAAIVAAWGVFALVNVVWVLLVVWPMDAAATREHATAEDPGRRTAGIIAVAGSVVSLVAVGIMLLHAHDVSGVQSYALAGISVLSVAASWTLIQIDYVLRYARMYYADPVGGIEFNQREDPEYTDFVYFSLGLGMTYQVADTNVTRNNVRRVVIAQTVLAYLFGTVILATIVNLVTSLS